MGIEFDDLPDWTFVVEEISAGAYKVSGKDKEGRNVELTGTDPDTLIGECKKYAEKVLKDNEGGGPS